MSSHFPINRPPIPARCFSQSQSEAEGSILWPRPTFRQQAWQDLHDNSAKLCREDDQVLFFAHVSQTSHNPKPLEAEGDINYVHFLQFVTLQPHSLSRSEALLTTYTQVTESTNSSLAGGHLAPDQTYSLTFAAVNMQRHTGFKTCQYTLNSSVKLRKKQH